MTRLPRYNHSREDSAETPCEECAAIAWLISEVKRLRAIVRDLAVIDPVYLEYTGGGPEEAVCALCSVLVRGVGDDAPPTIPHAMRCPYRRAVEEQR